MSTFGERLAEARDDKDWTQERLAQEIGRDQSTIAKWEKSHRTPQGVLDVVMRYAEILDVNPVWLLLGIEPKKGNVQMSKHIHYFRMLEALPEKDRDALFRMIEGLYERHGGALPPDPQAQGTTS